MRSNYVWDSYVLLVIFSDGRKLKPSVAPEARQMGYLRPTGRPVTGHRQ